MSILAVAIGAAIGAPCRYLLDRLVQSRHRTVFPWGLVVVNLLGSLLLGVLAGAAGRRRVPAWLMLALATGWCGGFTTYSSFGYETVQLTRQRRFVLAAANAVITVVGGVIAVVLGVWLGGRLAQW